MRFNYLLFLLFLLQSCASYNYAQKVKTISFSPDVSQGKSIGPIQGQDCTWTVLGNKLGGDPTVDKAFINTKKQTNELENVGLNSSNAQDDLRYVNNVSTERSGFNAGIIGKDCLVVKGMGFK